MIIQFKKKTFIGEVGKVTNKKIRFTYSIEMKQNIIFIKIIFLSFYKNKKTIAWKYYWLPWVFAKTRFRFKAWLRDRRFHDTYGLEIFLNVHKIYIRRTRIHNI